MTWTIIGSPAISASGLPGSRVEAMRAGIRTRTSAIAVLPAGHSHCAQRCSARWRGSGSLRYTGCQKRGKPAICAPPQSAAPAAVRRSERRCASLQAMDSFEAQQNPGRDPGHVSLACSAINIAAGAIFAPTKPAKPGYEIAVPEQTPAGKPAEARNSSSRSSSCSPMPMPAAARTRRRNARPATPSTRAGATLGRSQPVGRGRPAEGVGAGLQLFGRDEGARAAIGPSTISTSSSPIREAIIPGTNMTFAGIPARQRARRRHRLSQHALRQPGAAAQGGRGRRRREASSERSLHQQRQDARRRGLTRGYFKFW